MYFEEFESVVRYIGKEGLFPGLEAQLEVAPYRRHISDQIPQEELKQAAVMVLASPTPDNQAIISLIQRPDYDGHHGGQVSLPGGKVEQQDHDFQDTALRETEEELGISLTDIEVIGKSTSLIIPPSKFQVHPFWGITQQYPRYSPDPIEVKEIIELPVSWLLDDSAITNIDVTLNSGARINTPCFQYNSYVIWGATAMILSEFRVALRAHKKRLSGKPNNLY